jgi:hypothetical protein
MGVEKVGTLNFKGEPPGSTGGPPLSTNLILTHCQMRGPPTLATLADAHSDEDNKTGGTNSAASPNAPVRLMLSDWGSWRRGVAAGLIFAGIGLLAVYALDIEISVGPVTIAKTEPVMEVAPGPVRVYMVTVNVGRDITGLGFHAA